MKNRLKRLVKDIWKESENGSLVLNKKKKKKIKFYSIKQNLFHPQIFLKEKTKTKRFSTQVEPREKQAKKAQPELPTKKQLIPHPNSFNFFFRSIS